MDTALVKKNTIILETIVETDQQAIKDFRAGKITSTDLMEINRNNVSTVKKIITEIGFPTINLTSLKAYKAAVLVVLHSGDVDFLNESIKYLQNMDSISIQKRDVAYMKDKVRVIQKLPQLYGTQYNISEDGVLKYLDIENPEEIEKRREEYGMESFEEYKKVVEKSFQSKK